MNDLSISQAQTDMRQAYFDGAAGVLISGLVWLVAAVVAGLASAPAAVLALLLQSLHVEWFFPAMLLTIGARYLSFQTLYGLQLYWLCGAALGLAGIALLLLRAPVVWAAAVGAVIELVFAGLLFRQATRTTP